MRSKNPKLVVLCGLAGCGKTTCADYLVQKFGFDRVKFADPLKDMLRAIGLTHEHLEGKLKEEPCDLLLGKSPRYAMQTLGTEWGRNMIGQTIWVDQWKRQVQYMLDKGISVIVDDCRFPNELAAALDFPDCVTITIDRPGTAPVNAHVSEQHALKTQYTILNDESLERLLFKLRISLDL